MLRLTRFKLFSSEEFKKFLNSHKNPKEEIISGVFNINPIGRKIIKYMKDFPYQHKIMSEFLLSQNLIGYFLLKDIKLNPDCYEEGFVKEGSNFCLPTANKNIILSVKTKQFRGCYIDYNINLIIEDMEIIYIDLTINTQTGEIEEKVIHNDLSTHSWLELISLSYIYLD